jgi:4-alpha-glucanotransferase
MWHLTSDPRTRRRSGLLLHITSLPGPFGIGDLGPEAHNFASRISRSGQTYWQVLPVSPTGYGNSPYSSLSSFAGNVLLISPEGLVEAGLMEDGELTPLRVEGGDQVDFVSVYAGKLEALKRTAATFATRASADEREALARFSETHGEVWLNDYCLYMALKEANGGKSWNEWEPELANRDVSSLAAARDVLCDEIEIQGVLQFLFFEQWKALRRVAADHGVEMVGDLPLYVAHDSADVWANRDLFLLDGQGMPVVVAGVPPDYFSETGQRWGNPIFDWKTMAADGFLWWKMRMSQAVSLFDIVRIDHFRGIAGYWEIPASEPTAVGGRWRPGPGASLFEAIRDELGEIPVIAEDLGVITDDVIALRERFGLPGMRVAQFGFDDAPDSSIHHPEAYPLNVWAYTGTHDNNTTKGWFWEENPRHRLSDLQSGRRDLYQAVDGDIPWGLVEMVSRSRARVSIFPLQDILGLGREARMNTPGTIGDNWGWRLLPGQLTDEKLDRLLELTRDTGRAQGRGTR